MTPQTTTAPDRLLAIADQLAAAGDIAGLRRVRDQLRHAKSIRHAARHAARYANDPVAWVTDRLGQTVWSKQAQIMRAVRDHRKTAVRSGHGVGKSHVAALIAGWWIDTHKPGQAFVVTTAPTFPQVRAILWRYVRRVHRAGRLVGRVNQTEWHIDDELVAFGRKPADHDESAFQGIHARYVLVIIDEACGVASQLWIAADALATNTDCRLFAIGNPDDSSSHFRHVCRPESAWHTIRISAFDSPNLTGEPIPTEVAKSLVSREWVEEKAVEWGVDNPLYQSKVLGEFSDDAPNKVIRFSSLTARRVPPDTPHQDDDLLPVELGVDVGGGGDETVIRERRGRVAGREWRAHTSRPETIAPMVLAAIRDTGATSVKVDSIGVGFGLVGELRNAAASGLHTARIVAVNVAAAASRPKVYANLRAEIWWEIGREPSADPNGWDLSEMDNADVTIAQLAEPTWDLDPKGRIRVEPKKDVISRTGRSPDNADALLLAYYRGQRGDTATAPTGTLPTSSPSPLAGGGSMSFSSLPT